jgi:hypothetical protein
MPPVLRYPTVLEGGDTGAMTRDEVLAICLGLPAAEETYPFGMRSR